MFLFFYFCLSISFFFIFVILFLFLIMDKINVVLMMLVLVSIIVFKVMVIFGKIFYWELIISLFCFYVLNLCVCDNFYFYYCFFLSGFWYKCFYYVGVWKFLFNYILFVGWVVCSIWVFDVVVILGYNFVDGCVEKIIYCFYVWFCNVF